MLGEGECDGSLRGKSRAVLVMVLVRFSLLMRILWVVWFIFGGGKLKIIRGSNMYIIMVIYIVVSRLVVLSKFEIFIGEEDCYL